MIKSITSDDEEEAEERKSIEFENNNQEYDEELQQVDQAGVDKFKQLAMIGTDLHVIESNSNEVSHSTESH